jgi:hypothetical protein
MHNVTRAKPKLIGVGWFRCVVRVMDIDLALHSKPRRRVCTIGMMIRHTLSPKD